MNENTATKQAKDETQTSVTSDAKNNQEETKTNSFSDTATAYKEKVGEYAQQGLEKANQYKQQAADALASSKDYIKNFDYSAAGQQIKTTVKEKPEVSIAIAGIFGLLIGLLIGRRTRS